MAHFVSNNPGSPNQKASINFADGTSVSFVWQVSRTVAQKRIAELAKTISGKKVLSIEVGFAEKSDETEQNWAPAPRGKQTIQFNAQT